MTPPRSLFPLALAIVAIGGCASIADVRDDLELVPATEGDGGARDGGDRDGGARDGGSPGCVQCGLVCVDTTTDPKHCGACDRACPGNQQCVAAKCVPR